MSGSIKPLNQVSTENKTSLIHIDAAGLSDVAKTFIDHVANFWGGALRPTQIRRVAQAEADAALIKKMSEIQLDSLERRAFVRAQQEQIRHQENMEGIATEAAKGIKSTPTELIDEDWLEMFFQNARHISNADTQAIWAKILSSEYNQPGTISKRTLAVLNSLDRREAEIFRQVCRFTYHTDVEARPLILRSNDPIYSEAGITGAGLIDLESVGLISRYTFSATIEIPADNFPSLVPIGSGEITLAVSPAGGAKKTAKGAYHLPVGFIAFTRTGKELSTIADKENVPGFAEYVKARFEQDGFQVGILRS